jgi:hypothetical protein
MKKIVMTVAICLSILTGKAQTETKPVVNKHAVGVAAGVTTGYGLAYRYQATKFGTQVTFAPYKNSYESHISLGVTFLYKMASFEKAQLFLYQGNHFSSTRSSFGSYNSYSGAYQESGSKTQFVNNGLGLDIEFLLNQHLGFHIMAGYAGYQNFKEIGMTGETALFIKL